MTFKEIEKILLVDILESVIVFIFLYFLYFTSVLCCFNRFFIWSGVCRGRGGFGADGEGRGVGGGGFCYKLYIRM